MNLYRGCSHGCIYCDSRINCYHIENFGIVKGKENMLNILENELSKKRKNVPTTFSKDRKNKSNFTPKHNKRRNKAPKIFTKIDFLSINSEKL